MFIITHRVIWSDTACTVYNNIVIIYNDVHGTYRIMFFVCSSIYCEYSVIFIVNNIECLLCIVIFIVNTMFIV